MLSRDLACPARSRIPVGVIGALAAAAFLYVAPPTDARLRDSDRDGLSNRFEKKRSFTNPRRADTDRDGLRDRFELRSSRTNPRRKDTDRDGLSDRIELRRDGSNPRLFDTDGDGVGDGLEVLIGTNPLKPDSPTPPPPPPPPPDTTAPETTISAGPSGTVATDSASFSFSSSETGSSFECQLDGGAWAACSSPRAYPGLANGPHSFSVRAPDAAGNTDTSPATRSWTVAVPPPPPPPDTTAPETTISAGPSGTVATDSASFSFSSSETGSSFECQLDGGAWAACSSPRAYPGLANGPHSFSVRATDAAGNTDTSPATRSWTVNVPPPPPGPLGYTLPADRTYDWNPGLNAVGGIPARTAIYRTISPSGGDDTATIQSALNTCPVNGVVQLTAGRFNITGQGLAIGRSNCTLRGAGPGPGTWPVGTPASGTGGTYLVKPRGTSYPVVIIGPRWGGAGPPPT